MAGLQLLNNQPKPKSRSKIGLNLEFARTAQFDLEAALRCAAEAGYRFVEPYVYSEVSLNLNSHLTLRTGSPYHHLNADHLEVARLNRLRSELGLRFSPKANSRIEPLNRPEWTQGFATNKDWPSPSLSAPNLLGVHGKFLPPTLDTHRGRESAMGRSADALVRAKLRQ